MIPLGHRYARHENCLELNVCRWVNFRVIITFLDNSETFDIVHNVICTSISRQVLPKTAANALKLAYVRELGSPF